MVFLFSHFDGQQMLLPGSEIHSRDRGKVFLTLLRQQLHCVSLPGGKEEREVDTTASKELDQTRLDFRLCCWNQAT